MKVYYVLYEKDIEFKKPPFFKDKVVILYTFPYKKLAKKLKDWFESRKAKAVLIPYLGCHAIKADVLIADGLFHLKSALIKNKAIWFFDGKWKKIRLEQKNKERGFLIEYKNKVGIIVSLKPGQNNLNLAFKLKEKLKKLGKEVYLFIFDEVSNLEDFNFIELWINTACPRIEGRNIIQAYEVFNYLKLKEENKN